MPLVYAGFVMMTMTTTTYEFREKNKNKTMCTQTHTRTHGPNSCRCCLLSTQTDCIIYEREASALRTQSYVCVCGLCVCLVNNNKIKPFDGACDGAAVSKQQTSKVNRTLTTTTTHSIYVSNSSTSTITITITIMYFTIFQRNYDATQNPKKLSSASVCTTHTYTHNNI